MTDQENYDDEYRKWKSWNNSSFGNLTRFDIIYFDSELAKAKRNFRTDSSVLEIGFGNGSFLTYAKQKQWQVVGTEANDELVAVAREAGFSVRQAADMSAFDHDSFDLVVAFDVLEHIPQEELPAFLTTISQILKKGGMFVARFPNGDSPFGLANQNGDITHVTSLGSAKVNYLMQRADFDILSVAGEAMPVFSGDLKFTIHRFLTWPIIAMMKLFMRVVFFPRSNISYFSRNLVSIVRK